MFEGAPKRALVVVGILLLGVVPDWVTFETLESSASVVIPNFNYVTAALVRLCLVLVLIAYFAVWRAASGKQTVIQQLLFWPALTISFIAPQIAARSKTATLDIGWSFLIGACAVVVFVWFMASVVKPSLRELNEGTDFSDEQYTPLVSRLLYIGYPPRSRFDMIGWDFVFVAAIAFAVSGRWLVVESG